MNLFVLDTDLSLNAQYHVDRHVVKMPLEAAQIASTVLRGRGTETKYKPTHAKHPCTLWAGATDANLDWTIQYGLALCKEYTFRYGKTHGCESVLMDLAQFGRASRGSLTAHAQAMPEAFKRPDAVSAYRAYYIGEKQRLFAWKNRPTPDWIVL